jgi:hypothetical protein
MKKHKLNAENLKVEAFETSPSQRDVAVDGCICLAPPCICSAGPDCTQ